MKNIRSLALPFLFISLLSGCSIFDTSGGRNIGGNWNNPLPSPPTAEITAFSIGSNVGTISGNNISVVMPYGTVLTSLTPTITYSGTNISPTSGVAQNFSSPVTYTVTGEDNSTQVYTVTVAATTSTSKSITSFSILGVAGIITGTNISVTVPFGTSLASLTPTITYTGVSISPASGVAANFASPPVTYTVTAADGSTKSYAVTVTVATSSSKDITSFSILGSAGTIAGTNIAITVPYGTSLGSLTPTIVYIGANISPASGVANNFTSPATYTVTATDSSTKSYIVTVTAAAGCSTASDCPDPVNDYCDSSNHTCYPKKPYGTSTTSATYCISGVVYIDGGTYCGCSSSSQCDSAQFCDSNSPPLFAIRYECQDKGGCGDPCVTASQCSCSAHVGCFIGAGMTDKSCGGQPH